MEAWSGFNSTSSVKCQKKQSTYFVENKYSVKSSYGILPLPTLNT